MRKLFFILFVPVMVFSGVACEKECDCVPNGQFEYMIFGTFVAECGNGGCVEMFRIDREKLYKDSSDVFPSNEIAFEGEFYPLPDEKYQQVKDLLKEFPNELYEEPDNVLGIPDGGDWGGVYVEIKLKDLNSLSGFWLLDQNEENMDQVYNDFVYKINEKITLINQ
jgi:hypothetical protein